MISSDLGQEYKTMSLSLDRIKKFLSSQNIEYKKLKYIHIAGTNGKGSTARMLAAILETCGYKTGLYTSPHLIKINERIQINSKCISNRELNFIEKEYGEDFERYKLTYFEKITAIAFIYFAKKKTDIVVLETGLGGRYDATNIITPLVSVITSIDLDHTEVLGKTLKEIAFEKAGIIKEKVPVVCGNLSQTALREICRVAKGKNSQVFAFGHNFSAELVKYEWKKNGRSIEVLRYRGIETATTNDNDTGLPRAKALAMTKLALSLLGQAQVYNAAVVLKACEILKEKLKKIEFKTIKKTLKNIKWPARFDIRKLKIKNKKCSIIIDGGHNEQAVENFLNLYKQSPFYKKENKLCFAIMQEKNYKKVIKMIACEFQNINLIKLDNSRAVDTDTLKKEFSKYIDKDNIKIYDDVSKIFENIKNKDMVVVLGSFFLAGKVIKFVEDKLED